MAFHGPVSFRYKGDKTVALRYVRDARRLLDDFRRELGAATSGRKVTKAGSATITLTIAMGITIVVIDVGGGKKLARWFEDFVGFSGAQAIENGEVVYYPVIMQPNQDPDNPGWRTFFRSANAPGYAAAPNPKGSYLTVFPRSELSGLKGAMSLHGTNRVHVNERGEAINYTVSGGIGYFIMPYRTPWSTCSFVVFHQGHVALNTVQYNLENGVSDTNVHILGAGMHDGWLYTVQSMLYFSLAGNIYDNPPSAPDTTDGKRRTTWTSPMWYDGSTVIVVRRYRMIAKMDERSGAWHYEAADGSMEQLYSGTIQRGFNYYTFNTDCSQCVSYQLPQQAVARFDGGELQTTPSTSSFRLGFNIDTEEGTASLFSNVAGTDIAEDNGKKLHFSRSGRTWTFATDEWQLTALDYGEWGYTSAVPLFLDLKNGWGVFAVSTTTWTRFSETTQASTEVTLRMYKPDGSSEDIHSLGPTSGELETFAALSMINAFDAAYVESNACSMAAFYMNVIGVVSDEWEPDPDDPENEPPLFDRFYAITSSPLHLLQWSPGEHGTSFGGVYITSAGDQYQEGWGTWDIMQGYDGFNSAYPYAYVEPEEFTVTSAGAATTTEAMFGLQLRLRMFSSEATVQEVNYNHITNGNLEQLTGGLFNSERFLLSVNILGRPPVNQMPYY